MNRPTAKDTGYLLFVILATICCAILIQDVHCQTPAPAPAPPLPKPTYHIRVPGHYPCECALGPADSYLELLPCAWRISQLELAERYPQWANDMYNVARPKAFITKPWYEKVDGKRTLIHGDTQYHRRIPIRIARTGNIDEDFDSMLHEFKHWIIHNMHLKDLTKWVLNLGVDMIDSHWMEDYKLPN